MTKAIFQNHGRAVANFLHQSERSIDVAMCWFSNPYLFSILLKKARRGVKIRLIVQFDQANFHIKGLPFFRLIEAGSFIHAYDENNLLHHKFALVDERKLLTGSYNWTRTQHADNILITEDKELVTPYQSEFDRLWQKSEPLELLIKKRPPSPGFYKLFKPVICDIADLRQAIVQGAKVWISVFREKEMPIWQQGLQMQRHFLKGKADFFELNRGVWDFGAFEDWLNRLSVTQKRLLKNYCLKMRTNDILISVRGDGNLLGVGIVGSSPEPSHLKNYCFARYVQWFEFPDRVEPLKKMPSGPFGVFRGSGLRLVSLLEPKSIYK